MSTSTAGFVGTWRLGDSYSEGPAGRSSLPLGENVIGRINYDSAGNMAAQLMSAGRQPFSDKNPAKVADAEYRVAFQTYTSYFGTYTVDADAGTVTHHVEGASVPGWPGHDQLRYFELDGDVLTLRTPPMRDLEGNKAVHTLVWHRVTKD
ncbi:MAG: lipocalin-like domain-containing protein [Gammaproteobacteria bacterium]